VDDQAAARNRLPAKAREHEQSAGRRHLAGIGQAARRRVEAGIEALAELGVVLLEAPAPGRAARALHGDRDEGCRQQPFHRLHGGDELSFVALAQRLEDGRGKRFRARLELVPLPLAPGRQDRAADAGVGRVGPKHHQSFSLERAEQPTQIARVEPEPGAKIADLCPGPTDLPEEPGLAERARASEEPLAQRPCSLRRDPVEPADLCDVGSLHSLTKVRNITRNRAEQVPRTS
jgi:hypothetical protein